MGLLAAAFRLSSRSTTRQITRNAAHRGISSTASRCAASNLTMPALSPTMMEGNIAQWKLKEGDSFVAGDALLEIETDKAQMDFEAQEDGILAKITQGDGSKGVKVGERIGVLAEEGDDLQNLEMPPEPSKSTESTTAPADQTKSTPDKSKQSSQSSSSSTTASKSSTSKLTSARARKQTYPPLPSVLQLLHENGLSLSEVDNIPATGPNGRLLKGDVLAHLGKIDKAYPSELSKSISARSHLDLSNIQLAPSPEKGKSEDSKKPAKAISEDTELEPFAEISLPISLKAALECQSRIQESTGVHLPLSTFVTRATWLANEDLPKPKGAKPTTDELFNSLVQSSRSVPKTSRGRYVPDIFHGAPVLASSRPTAKKPDPFDVLVGKGSGMRSRQSTWTGAKDDSMTDTSVFSLIVESAEENRGRVFLSRLKLALETEPGRLIL